MKYFISGGAGFIGSHFVDLLLKCPDVGEITIFDNFSSGTDFHVSRFIKESKVNILVGDIKDLEMLSNSMRGSNFVAHFAANPDISKAISQPDIDFWEGTYLVNNILEAMRKNDVNKLIYTSGSGVYGEALGVEFSESYGPCFPISTYGASKLACEALICSYCHMFGIRARAFRFANVVGPRQTHGVGYDFVRKLKADNTTLRILGDGTQTKSYIHVDDVLDALLIGVKLLIDDNSYSNSKSNSNCYDVFNVATDDYIDVYKIALLACEVFSINSENVVFEYTGGDRGWKGDVPQVLFDVSKIKSLNWRARYSSSAAIKRAMIAMLSEI
jgi:UDP-glucose 4-epimerase